MVHSLYLRRFILHIVVLIALVVANDLLSCRDVSSLADALPLSSCCWVDALPPVVASSLADALPPFFFSGGCFAAVVVLFGRCFATDLVLRACSLGIFGDSISSLCKFSSSGGICLGGGFGVPSPSMLLQLSFCRVRGFGHLCVCLYFSSVFLCL